MLETECWQQPSRFQSCYWHPAIMQLQLPSHFNARAWSMQSECSRQTLCGWMEEPAHRSPYAGSVCLPGSAPIHDKLIQVVFNLIQNTGIFSVKLAPIPGECLLRIPTKICHENELINLLRFHTNWKPHNQRPLGGVYWLHIQMLVAQRKGNNLIDRCRWRIIHSVDWCWQRSRKVFHAYGKLHRFGLIFSHSHSKRLRKADFKNLGAEWSDAKYSFRRITDVGDRERVLTLTYWEVERGVADQWGQIYSLNTS